MMWIFLSFYNYFLETFEVDIIADTGLCNNFWDSKEANCSATPPDHDTHLFQYIHFQVSENVQWKWNLQWRFILKTTTSRKSFRSWNELLVIELPKIQYETPLYGVRFERDTVLPCTSTYLSRLLSTSTG